MCIHMRKSNIIKFCILIALILFLAIMIIVSIFTEPKVDTSDDAAIPSATAGITQDRVSPHI